jgi:hypothetical protein
MKFFLHRNLEKYTIYVFDAACGFTFRNAHTTCARKQIFGCKYDKSLWAIQNIT